MRNKKKAAKNGVLDKATTIKVKISGDGTNIGKRLKLENVTYTILNEKDAAMNEKGNYVLAIIRTTENYDNLKESLADLNNEMSNLKEITVNNHKYSIEYFFRRRLEVSSLCLWSRSCKSKFSLY